MEHSKAQVCTYMIKSTGPRRRLRDHEKWAYISLSATFIIGYRGPNLAIAIPSDYSRGGWPGAEAPNDHEQPTRRWRASKDDRADTGPAKEHPRGFGNE